MTPPQSTCLLAIHLSSQCGFVHSHLLDSTWWTN